VLTIIILVAATVAYGMKNGLIYELLLGPGSSVQTIESVYPPISAFYQTVFGDPVLNRMLFFIFWVLVGLVALVMVTGIGRGIGQVNRQLHELQYANLRKTQLEESLMQRALLRTIAALFWFGYGVLFLKFFLPFSILAARIGFTEIRSLTGILYLTLGFVILSASLHLHIVFLRLFLLRPRVFGGWDIVDESDHLND
jgi:hypothetical protein